MESDTIKIIAAILLSIILMVGGVLDLVGNSLGWKRFRISGLTLFFCQKKDGISRLQKS
jgi:hypothetical protein